MPVRITRSSTAAGGDTSSLVVVLNVGGQHVDVLKSTLLKADEGSILRQIVTDNKSSNGSRGSTGHKKDQQQQQQLPLDKNGRVFLDRNPVTFQLMMDYLRGIGVLATSSPDIKRSDAVRLRQEAEHFGLRRLVRAMDELYNSSSPLPSSNGSADTLSVDKHDQQGVGNAFTNTSAGERSSSISSNVASATAALQPKNNSAAIIELNVSGTSIDVLRSNLLKAEKQSFLWTIANCRHDDPSLVLGGEDDDVIVKDKNGRIFVDSDPSLFKMIINHLRGRDVVHVYRNSRKMRSGDSGGGGGGGGDDGGGGADDLLPALYQEAEQLGLTSLMQAIEKRAPAAAPMSGSFRRCCTDPLTAPLLTTSTTDVSPWHNDVIVPPLTSITDSNGASSPAFSVSSSSLYTPSHTIVKLNVGGTCLDVSSSTLGKAEKHGALWNIFNGPMQGHTYDDNGRIFLDRDAVTFQMILNHLRELDVLTGKLRPDLEPLYQEAVYFGLDSLAEAVENCPDRRVTTEKYVGEMKGFHFHGRGTAKLDLGEHSGVYIGEWLNGRRDGSGVMVFDDGDKYEGEWKLDKKHGDGVYEWASGSLFVGKFKNDSRTGIGTMSWIDGFKWIGQWENDKRNGEGVETSPDGVETKGTWIEDVRQEE